VRKNQHVCVVLYGHPAVFAKPGIDAVLQAKKEGYPAKMLPGISAEDCLYADLLINVGTCGHQSFEATEFLIHRRHCDPSAHVFLWQVGFIGALNHPRSHDNSKGIKLLTDYLSRSYDMAHNVTLYEAAQYPGFDPRINHLPLQALPDAKISAITTLYIPPAHKMKIDKEMLEALGINIPIT
jgi:tetrapyrrole methylase family protein/MazG family protein